MSDVADYDADILLWSERQAALLRELKGRAHGLPNELDIENLAEEIETVGRSEVAAVESLLVQLLVHVLKAVSVGKPTLVAHWRSEAVNFRQQATRRLTPAISQRLDMNSLWRDALELATSRLAEHEDDLAPGLPGECPFDAVDLTGERADFDKLVEAVEASRMKPGDQTISV